MKILLFADNASRTHTNLAVRSLRCALRDHQIEAEILETHPKEKSGDVLQKLYESGADIFGFSIYLWNLEDMLRYARALKTLCPDVFIFFGGPEVSYETADFFGFILMLTPSFLARGRNRSFSFTVWSCREILRCIAS